MLVVQSAGVPRDGVRASLGAPAIQTQAPEDRFLQTASPVDAFTGMKAF